jgi:hypothetical protein
MELADNDRKPVRPELGLKMTDAEFIYMLVVNILDDPKSELEPLWRHELYALVARNLEEQEDEPLDSALHMLHTADHPLAQAFLRNVLEAASESGGVIGTDTDTKYQSRLFTIPVIVQGEAGLPNGVIPPQKPFKDLLKSFENKALFGDSKVSLANYLYHPAELQIEWSEKLALVNDIRVADKLKDYAPMEQLNQMPELVEALYEDESSTSLRYLVGVLTYPEKVEPPILSDDENAYDATVSRQWQDQLTGLIQAAMKKVHPDVDFLADTLLSFHDGIRRGVIRHKIAVTYGEVVEALEEKDILPAEVKALVVRYETDSEDLIVGASLLSKLDNRLIGGCTYVVDPGLDEEEDAIEAIKTILDGLKITPVEVVEETYPFEFCEGCQQPKFLAPDPNEKGELRFAHTKSSGHTLH